MTQLNKSAMDDFDSLLERERQHLLKGDLPKFAEILHEKELLLKQMSPTEVSELSQLSHVQERLLYNQSLLEAAMRGIRTAAERLQALRNIRDGLDTYNSQGERKTFASQSRNEFERRA